jgi:hypothetical protein
MDNTAGDSVIELDAPMDSHHIAALLRDNERFAIDRIISRTYGEVTAAVSAQRLRAIAGKYTGKDNPVAILWNQGIFPAPEERGARNVRQHRQRNAAKARTGREKLSKKASSAAMCPRAFRLSLKEKRRASPTSSAKYGDRKMPTDGDLQHAKDILGDQSIVGGWGTVSPWVIDLIAQGIELGRRLERERIFQDHLQDHLLKKHDR